MLTAVLALALAIVTTTPTYALFPRSDGPVDISLIAPNRSATGGRSWIEDAATRLFAKYADLLPPGAPAKKRQQASLDTTLSDWYDWMYSTKVAIGTPPQDFYLRLDTATPYLWVYDEDCSTSNCTLAKATQSLFKHNESSTYKDLGETGTVTYVSSSCSGWWGTDTVGITNGLEGDARSTQSTDTYQFVRCTSGDVTNDPTQAVGIIGMSLRRDKYPDPLWLTLSPHWPEPRFGMYFGKQDVRDYYNMSGPLHNGGVMTLGGVNKSLFTGDIHYIPLDTTKYYAENSFFWQVPVDATVAGTVTFGKGTSIIDTGSALIMAPQTVCDAFYANVPRIQQSGSLGYYYFPCASAAGIKDLTFTFGGVNYTVPREELFRFEPTISHSGTDWCSGEVMPTPPGYGGNFIIGDTFLKNVYSVYQYDPPAVGFAQLVANGTTPVHPATPSSPGSTTPNTPNSPSGARRIGASVGVIAVCAVAAVLA